MGFLVLGRKTLRRGGWVLLAVLVASVLCWSFVHTDLRRQNEWVAKSRGMLWPVVSFGEALTGITDSIGLGGKEASVHLERAPRRTQHLYAGIPRDGKWLFSQDVDVLKNDGFVVGYSETMKAPRWVAYRIFEVDGLYSGDRPSRFKVDERTYAQVRHDDYTKSGYDRGHMAPNYGIATRYGRDAQIATFLMSNIVPQRPGLNRRAWKDVEMNVARFYGQSRDEVWVITGPIYGKDPDRLESGVAIPEAFFKIIVDEDEQDLRVLAFIFQQESSRRQWPRRHLVTIDAVEQETGLDFFSELPDGTEDELEAAVGTRMWSVPIGLQLKYAFKRY